MTMKKKVFMYKNYYRRIGFTKENCYYSVKHRNKKNRYCLKLN